MIYAPPCRCTSCAARNAHQRVTLTPYREEPLMSKSTQRRLAVYNAVSLAVLLAVVILGGVVQRAHGAEWTTRRCAEPAEVAAMHLGQLRGRVERHAELRGTGTTELADGLVTAVSYPACEPGHRVLVMYGAESGRLGSVTYQ